MLQDVDRTRAALIAAAAILVAFLVWAVVIKPTPSPPPPSGGAAVTSSPTATTATASAPPVAITPTVPTGLQSVPSAGTLPPRSWFVEGTPSWVASQYLELERGYSWKDPAYGSRRFALRPFVTDELWKKIDGTRTYTMSSGDLRDWAEIQELHQELRIEIKGMWLNPDASTEAEPILMVSYWPNLKDDTTPTVGRRGPVQSIQIGLIFVQGSWRVQFATTEAG